MTSPDRAAFVYVGAFVEELARAGVRHVVVAPGSRSTPLALTIAAHPRLRTWMHMDERSAAFFAVGMARRSASPVALLCTSGSAAANFLPAVVEAQRAGVALLVLTADRPPELRDVGASQTIDQRALYGAHAKWFVDVALPDLAPELLRYVRTLACRAVAIACAAPRGPVHLNFPFREPLVPRATTAPDDLSPNDALAWSGRADGAPWTHVLQAGDAADPAAIERIARVLRGAQRPLVVCGPQHDPSLGAPIAALAQAMGAPLLADPLSQVRWGAHDRTAVIDAYDAWLRHEPLAASLAPDVILRVGAVPTSKTLLDFLRRHGAAWSAAVHDSGWSDPTQMVTEMLHAAPASFCAALVEALRGTAGPASGASRDGEWLARWRAIDAGAGAALRAFTEAADEPFDGDILARVAAAVPSGGTLVVSSSMPVRDLDAFARGDGRPLHVLANRGANGIDGVVSTALGAAAADREMGSGPLVLAIGDLAFYHDMNGLLAARLHGLDATIVVINNDGGGIFSFLPQASSPEYFEQLFGTPHGLTFESAAALYGASYHLASDDAALDAALAAGIAGEGLHIVEARTDRARNVVLHRAAWAEVARAVGDR